MSIELFSDVAVHKAASLLRQGKLVAFATETVYGLGADATNDRAVVEIFSVKGRPQCNPLIVHVDSNAMASKLVEWTKLAEQLALHFWPGPLTLVMKRSLESPVSLLACAGGDTIAMRMPRHQGAIALIAAVGLPLAAPSANRSGRISPTTAQHVQDEFGNAIPMILDGGACLVGIESTVVDISNETPVLLRPGVITREQLETVLGCEVALMQTSEGILKSPGMLLKHYSPSLPVKLDCLNAIPGGALLAFGEPVPRGAKYVINLSPSADLNEAAAALFGALRALDNPEFSCIAVMPIPHNDIGTAINDRLKRAAAL